MPDSPDHPCDDGGKNWPGCEKTDLEISSPPELLAPSDYGTERDTYDHHLENQNRPERQSYSGKGRVRLWDEDR